MLNPIKNSDLSPAMSENPGTVPVSDTEAGLRVGFSFMEGWIKLHRKIRDNWIWTDPVKFQWWIDIILEVNHTAAKVPIGYDLIECEVGQSVRSLQGWAQRWKVSKDTARNFLKMLQKDNMIVLENLQKTTRITVCNYVNYQTSLHGQQTDSKRTANGQQTHSDPNNNNKKEKNKKNKKNDISLGDKSPYFKKCTDIYFQFYEKQVGLKPAFPSAEGKHLKELIAKLENSIKNKGGEISEKSVSEAFATLLNKLPKFYKDKIDIKIINSKYDGIIAEIRTKSGAVAKNQMQDILEQRKREREAAAAGG